MAEEEKDSEKLPQARAERLAEVRRQLNALLAGDNPEYYRTEQTNMRDRAEVETR